MSMPTSPQTTWSLQIFENIWKKNHFERTERFDAHAWNRRQIPPQWLCVRHRCNNKMLRICLPGWNLTIMQITRRQDKLDTIRCEIFFQKKSAVRANPQLTKCLLAKSAVVATQQIWLPTACSIAWCDIKCAAWYDKKNKMLVKPGTISTLKSYRN